MIELENFLSPFFKGIAVLLFLAGVSIMPFHDDWRYEITDDCPIEKASRCKDLFIYCHGMSLSFDPLSAVPKFNPGVYLATSKCFEHNYDPECKESCGYPKDTGTWWERFQSLGPWVFNFFPGAISYWGKIFTNKRQSKYTF